MHSVTALYILCRPARRYFRRTQDNFHLTDLLVCPCHVEAPVWLGVDPAGHQRNSHSGLSDVQQLRKRGWRVRSRRSRLAEGIELVRRRLDRGTLRISPNCVKLIAAMQAYHFDASRPGVEEPVKDGPDHACDALRYMLVNLEASGEAQVRQWV